MFLRQNQLKLLLQNHLNYTALVSLKSKMLPILEDKLQLATLTHLVRAKKGIPRISIVKKNYWWLQIIAPGVSMLTPVLSHHNM